MPPSLVKEKLCQFNLDLLAVKKLISARTVFLSIASKQSNANVTLKRVVCYVLAKLHPKHSSIQPIINQVEAILGASEYSDSQIYYALRIGRRWEQIVSRVSGDCGQLLTGLLYVLKGSNWERETNWHDSFNTHPDKSIMMHDAKACSNLINDIMSEIRAYLVFIPPQECRFNQEWLGHGTMQQAISSIATAFEASPKLKATESTDAAHLIIPLSFFASHEIPIELISSGASPRKRWSEAGEIIEKHPSDSGLHHDLIRICSSENLMNTLSQLHSFSAILWTSNLSFKLNEKVRGRIISSLPASHRSFWAMQAFILVYRAIPWRNLEHVQLETAPLISHIRYTLEGVRRYCSVRNISPLVRSDISLSLIESFRFSNIEWKQFTIRQAQEFATGLKDDYTHSCLIQRKSILRRLERETNYPIILSVLPVHANVRQHATSGHTLIQGALNHIQLDELNKAIDLLGSWRSATHQPSSMEYLVLYRKNLLLGRIFRYQGEFTRSLSCLKLSKGIAQANKNLIFLEDSYELACHFADTYLELGKPTKAEICLRAEMKFPSPKQATLVALAEALFAQKRYEEAESICLSLQPPLKKLDRLRLSIIQAKLSHVRARFDAAFTYWTEAMTSLSQFTLAGGHTTRMILRSQCDVLRRQGLFDLEKQSYEQLSALEECAGSNGALYWIAGLRQWLEFLGSENDPPEI